MSPTPKKSFSSYALRRWYWALAISLTCVVWVGVALALRPFKDADGNYSSNPYGLSTGLENKALDLFFQLRDVRRAGLRARGTNEPITIIEIDERAIKASHVRLQNWRRDWYARLIDQASKDGASVIGLDIYLSEEGGHSEEDKGYDHQLAKAMEGAGNVVIASKLGAGGFEAITPLPPFKDAAYTVGFVDLPLDSDGFVRSLPLIHAQTGGETEFSFATRLVEGYLAAHAVEGEPLQSLTPADDEKVQIGQRILPLRTDRNLQLDFRARSPAFVASRPRKFYLTRTRRYQTICFATASS